MNPLNLQDPIGNPGAVASFASKLNAPAPVTKPVASPATSPVTQPQTSTTPSWLSGLNLSGPLSPLAGLLGTGSTGQTLTPEQKIQAQVYGTLPQTAAPTSKPPVVSPTVVQKSDGTNVTLQDAANFITNYQNAQKNFSVPQTSSVPSTSLSGGNTVNGLLSTRNQMQSDMTSGANTTTAPSNNLLANVASQIYGASQFSPGQVSAMQNLSDINNQIMAQQLAERRQIQSMQEDGSITKEQANQYITEFQRRANAQLADLAVQQQGASTNLGVLNSIQQNQVQALQNYGQFLQPTQVSPGSTLYNPITGVSYQGTGASPQTITSYAQTLKTNDQMTGNLHLTPSGSVDDNYYIQQAQQAYSGNFGGGQSGTGTGVGGNTSTGVGGLPAQVQTYLNASGGQYINADKVPANQQDLVKQLAAQNGVPFLDSGAVSKMQSIQVTNDNLSQLSTVASRILGSGLTGRTIGALWNNIQSGLQLNTDISSYNAFRDTAINTIQALAGGTGSGLRLNQGEINTAIGNLPTISDNLETAQAKISLVQGFLNKWQSELLTGNPTAGGANGTVVQTAAGAINTNW